MKFPSIASIVTEIKAVCRRFPMELIVATVGAICAMWGACEVDNYSADNRDLQWILVRSIFACILLLNVAIITTIAREAGKISNLMRWVLFGALGAPLVWFVGDMHESGSDMALYVCSLVAVHAGVACTGVFNRSKQQFWEFNKSIFLRILAGGVYSAVLGAGMSVALVALDILFGVEIANWMYAWIWVAVIGLFNTLFFLGGMPDTPRSVDVSHDDTEAERTYPKSLRIFAQYVLLPLVALFIVILYAYAVKVLFFANLNGQVSTFIICLTAMGTLTYLLIYPLRNSSAYSWIRGFVRIFGLLLLPLSGMLWYSIGVRIATYGLTEDRAAVVLLGCFLTCLSIYMVIKRDPDIRVVPFLLLVTALAGFGTPWNMATLSYMSQTSRINAMLTAKNSLVNGKFHDRKDTIRLSPEEYRAISSVVYYLDNGDYQNHERINTWLTSIDAPFKRGDSTTTRLVGSASEIMDKFSLKELENVDKMHYVYTIDANYTLPSESAVIQSSLATFIRVNTYGEDSASGYTFQVGDGISAIIYENNPLWWKFIDGQDRVTLVNMEPYLHKRKYDGEVSEAPAGAVRPTFMIAGREVTFMFEDVRLTCNDGKVSDCRIEGMAFVKR